MVEVVVAVVIALVTVVAVVAMAADEERAARHIAQSSQGERCEINVAINRATKQNNNNR